MEKQKNKQNGITLIALVVTIIVLIILAGVSINMLVGENGIISMAQKAKKETEQAQQEELAELSSLESELEQAINGYNKEKGVNEPKLASGMSPIKFTEPSDSAKGTIVETNKEDEQWYHYEEKKWANAKTKDGSMWVWIPRFAYKVNSSTQNFDIVFLVGVTDTYYDENGELQIAKRCTSPDELVDTTTGYTVHPAFTDETNINYRNGGWDKEITGIWVAKFEAGYASGNNSAEVKASSVNYTQTETYSKNWLDGEYGTTTTAIKYPVFQPTTYSMNYINHSDAYDVAKTLTENGNIYGFTQNVNSHLMKNSEWGAVAYLSKSQYGLNTTDIAINSINLNNSIESVYAVTGCTTAEPNEKEKNTTINSINATTANTAVDGVYTWNQLNGTTASSTGTIYGIYDLSGGISEATTGYVANGSTSLKWYGKSIAYEGNNLKTKSTKYTTIYSYNSTTDNETIEDYTSEELDTAGMNNWISNKLIYGDAIQKISEVQSSNLSWYGDESSFPGLKLTFFGRGGSYDANSRGGLFCFGRLSGYACYYAGFRAVVIVS